MGKISTHIRVMPEDKELWNEFCKSLGARSPELFGKVIKSPKIGLSKRILEELRKKEDTLRKKAGF